MSDTPPEPDPAAIKAERRQKLIGRAVVIALGLLTALYLLPMFIRVFG